MSLPGLELRPLVSPACSESLYLLSHPGSSSVPIVYEAGLVPRDYSHAGEKRNIFFHCLESNRELIAFEPVSL
jgi:hypothetical protein